MVAKSKIVNVIDVAKSAIEKVVPIIGVTKNIITSITKHIKGENVETEGEVNEGGAKSVVKNITNNIGAAIEKVVPILGTVRKITSLFSGKSVENNETTFNENSSDSESIKNNFIKSLFVNSNKANSATNSNTLLNNNITKNGKEIEITPVDYMRLRHNMESQFSLTKMLEKNNTFICGSSVNASAIQSPSVSPMKPIGEKTPITPSIERIQYTTEKNNVPSDINLNINGSIRLEGNGLNGNFNLNELLKDEGFKRQMANIVKERLNAEGNASKLNKESSIINTQKMYNRT